MDTTPQMREMAQVMELIDSPHDQEAIQRILRSLQYSTFDSPALQPQPLMSNQASAGAGRAAAAGGADSDSVESLVAALTAGGNPYGQPIYAAMAQQFGPNWAQLGAPLLDDNQLLLAASAAAADVAARAKLGAEVLASRGGAAAAATAGVPASAAGGNSLLSGGPTPGLLTGHQLLLDDAKDMDPATMAEIDEDTVQITRMVIKIEPLHEETLRAIMVPWNEAVPEEQLTPSYLRSSVVDTIRYLAAVYLLTVADKYRCLPANDDRLELINNLMLSLWQGIGLLQPNVRDHIAQLLGVATPATADSICVAVTGLGIHSFFAALEPPVLERVCQELHLENCPPLRGAADPDALAPVYCDAIACHFYPTLRNQELGRCCFVRTTVHENGPGSFTCTVDTACLLSMMGLRSYVSNEFHCTSGGVKLPFRVKLQVNRVSKLSFFLCQRRVPSGVKAKLILRSASEAKARKAASLGGPNAVLFKESTGVVDSEMHFGFTDLISVADVLAADTTRGGVGPRGLYNQNEDRLVFQFSLSFDPPAAHLLAEPAAAAAPAVDKEKKKQPPQPPAGKKAPEPPKEVPKTKKEKQAEAAAAALALEEEEQRERRAREAQKLQLVRQKRVQAFEKEEQVERDKFTQSQAASWSALCEEAKKSSQKELQRQRDRERKAELARMMPLVELQQQVQQLQQQVTQAKQALHKAQTEKNAMAKEATRAAAALAEREAAVEQELREIDEAEEELLRVDEELEKAETELKARHEQEEVTRRQRSIDPLAQGAGGTARIDMTSFWFTSGSSPAAGNAPSSAAASNPAASLAAPGQPNRVQPATTGHGSPGSGRARNAPAPAPSATPGVLQGLNGTPLGPGAVAPPPFSATSSSPQPGAISGTSSGVTGPLLGPTLTGSSPLPNVPSFMPHTRIPSSPAMQPPVHPPPHLHHQQQQHASHQTAAALLHQHHQLAPHLPHGIMGTAPPYQPPQHSFTSMRPPLAMLPSDGIFGGGSTQSTLAPPPSFATGGNVHHPAPGAFGRGLAGFAGESGLTGAFPPRWGSQAAPAPAGGSGALLQIASPLPAADSMLSGPGPAPSFMRGQLSGPSNNGTGSASATTGIGSLELGVW